MNTESKTRNCPRCKEEIKADAIKCKHCGSSIAPEKPPHEGTCPYCKEEIHPEAIKCKHCKSNLTSEEDSGFGHNMPFRNLGNYPSLDPSTTILPRSESYSTSSKLEAPRGECFDITGGTRCVFCNCESKLFKKCIGDFCFAIPWFECACITKDIWDPIIISPTFPTSPIPRY